jgi:16S rRNA processing protein RimM
MTTDKQILLGRILGPHGVKGEVKIKSFTADPLDVASYGSVMAPDGRRFRLERTRLQGDVVIASIKGIADRNAAETLKGVELSVDRDDLPETEDGEFYQADLIGLSVYDQGGDKVGEVAGFQHFGAGDLLEIRRAGGKTSFVPFADSMVPDVDVEAGRVTLSESGMAVLAADEAAERKAGTQ